MFFLFSSINIYAQEQSNTQDQINTDELEQSLPEVTFINYEGPQAVINTRAQITSIGTSLGSGSGDSRYFVVRSITDDEPDKLNADIIGLGPGAGVDHIRNLRLIIAGYLVASYNYSAEDAATLASFITVYNAVYRGNMNYLGGKYKSAVMGHITQDNAGLSTNYQDWPGKTMMLIPLGKPVTPLSTVDTSALTEPAVVDNLRNNEDNQGVEQRQNMVDLKERESDAANQQAQDLRDDAAKQQEAVDTGKQEVAQQKQEVETEKQNIADEQQKLDQDKAAGNVTPQEAQAKQDELDQRAQDNQQKEQEVAQKEDDLNQQQAQATQTKQAADDAQAVADQKSGEAQAERDGIQQDQQNQIDNAPPAPAADTSVLAIKMAGTNAKQGQFVIIDTKTGSTAKTSALNTVAIRSVQMVGGKVFAIAGDASAATGAVRLIELDTTGLTIATQGTDDINADSLLWVNGNDLYAITASGGKNYIARFNASLAKQAQSATAVNASAGVFIQNGKLMTQAENGSALVLDASTLN